MRLIKFTLATLPLLAGLCFAPIAQAVSEKTITANKQKFINKMVKEHKFDRKSLTATFNKFSFKEKIIKSMNRQAEDMTWGKYKPIFLTQKRTDQGIEFWKKHEATLAKASKEYGVPAEIIVAIIGVETSYGRITGGYQVIDALGTLAFGYPRRAEFFGKELETFLLITREQGIDPLTVEGSYAGAMGIPQFMPSSYQTWAVDFDGDGKKDLWKNPADAIGSVANYFKRHKWKTGEDVTFPVKVAVEKTARKALTKRIKYKYTLKQLATYGISIPNHLNKNRKGLLIDLTLTSGKKEYWLGLHNFYVITRYNRSTLYAMAVYQLSQSLAKARKGA